MVSDKFEWEISLYKYLTHSTTDLTFNDNFSTLIVFKKQLINMTRNVTFSIRNIQVTTDSFKERKELKARIYNVIQ